MAIGYILIVRWVGGADEGGVCMCIYLYVCVCACARGVIGRAEWVVEDGGVCADVCVCMCVCVCLCVCVYM